METLFKKSVYTPRIPQKNDENYVPISDTKQASAAPEPVYTDELVDKSSELKLEKNPTYSVNVLLKAVQRITTTLIPASHACQS